jgi:hypothetical protein
MESIRANAMRDSSAARYADVPLQHRVIALEPAPSVARIDGTILDQLAVMPAITARGWLRKSAAQPSTRTAAGIFAAEKGHFVGAGGQRPNVHFGESLIGLALSIGAAVYQRGREDKAAKADVLAVVGDDAEERYGKRIVRRAQRTRADTQQ